MAGSNSIQFLRGNNISGSGQTLLPGQPAYDISTGYLYVGKGSTIASTSPVKASYANSAGQIPGILVPAPNGEAKLSSNNLHVSGTNTYINGYSQLVIRAAYVNVNGSSTNGANLIANINSANLNITNYCNINTNMYFLDVKSEANIYCPNGTVNIYGDSVMVRTGTSYVITFPKKLGTVALTSDIKSPTVTNNGDGTVNITFD